MLRVNKKPSPTFPQDESSLFVRDSGEHLFVEWE